MYKRLDFRYIISLMINEVRHSALNAGSLEKRTPVYGGLRVAASLCPQ
jgi:hypothetical protein